MYSPAIAPSTRYESPVVYSSVPSSPTLVGLFLAQPNETFAPGQAVFWEGDAAGHVFLLTEGCLRLCRVLTDGRRAIMGFAFDGEMLGVSFADCYLSTAEAVTKVRVRRLSRSRFHTTVDASPDLRPQLLAQICAEVDASRRHVIVLGQLSAEERVVSFLLSKARRTGTDLGEPLSIELPMSRLDMADFLGLTIETVCRILSKLKRQGLIGLEGRHAVVLRRLADLRRLGGEDDEPGAPSRSRVSVRHAAAWPN